MPKHDQMCWNHKITHETKLGNTSQNGFLIRKAQINMQMIMECYNMMNEFVKLSRNLNERCFRP